MKQQKKKLKHKVIEFGKGRSIALGKYEKGYSLILERPLETSDYGEAPQFAEVVDGKLVTQLGITEEAMDNIVKAYNEYNYNSFNYMISILGLTIDEENYK